MIKAILNGKDYLYALRFCSSEETRYYLKGSSIEPLPDNSVMMVATDGKVFDGQPTEVDHGDVCVNYDIAWFAKHQLQPPASLDDLVKPGGRLCRQRDIAHDLITQIPGVSCVKPKAALYMFPRLDPKVYPIADDQQFAYELLAEEKLLIVQGTGFNWPTPDHFRLVFLPNSDDLTEAIGRIARFCAAYRKRHGTG